MKIVMVSGHACIRVQKMALALIDRGHEVHLIARKMPPYYENYATICHAPGINHYLKAIEIYSKTANIFHAHNEPSWFVTAIKETCDTPTVLDVHDSYLARMTDEEQQEWESKGEKAFRVYAEERNNFQMADALVYPAEPFKNVVEQEFMLKQPSLVLPSMLPKMLFQYHAAEWLGGLVYEGRVDLKSSYENKPKKAGFRYCDYEELAKKAHEIGIDFHTYALRKDDEFKEIYDDIAFCHDGRPMDELLTSLSRHDWGLVGNTFYTPEWNVALPNKLFEYIAACVPVVAMNADYCADFVVENGFGIKVDSLEELAERWSEHEQVRKTLIQNRQSVCMENHIHKLEALYKEVL